MRQFLFKINLVVLGLVLLYACSQKLDKQAIPLSTASTPNMGRKTVFLKSDIAEDATPAVLAVVSKVTENGTSEIKFEKATYHFYPDKGLERFCRISNHDDVLIHTAFPILGLKNLRIDGQGSTFIFHGKMIPFLIEGAEKIDIQNVRIDWAKTFNSEVLIVANDTINRTFDIKIPDKYPYEIRDEELFFIKEYYEHTIGQSILYDPERKAIAFNTEVYTPIRMKAKTALQHNIDKIKYKYKVDHRERSMKYLGTENRVKVKPIAPGIVRVFNHKKKMPPVGMILSCKGEQSQNRVAPAFRITTTNGFNAKNITVHHAGGMGLIAENSADLILDNFNVTPSDGRMVSTTADATHFVGCRGKVTLKNCLFENQLDDATNVHGSYQEVVDIFDDYTIGARVGHAQQLSFPIGKPNDKIGFLRLSNSFFPYEKNTLKNREEINGRYQILTFNEKLPSDLQKGDLIENLDACPDVLVENCTIRGNRARGLLLSSSKSTIIQNNFFHTEMEALLIPVESGHWYESGNATNVIIRNNTFQDCQHSGFNRGVIRFATDDDNENIAFKNIEISNNQFHHFDNWILQITNVDGLKFTGNTITNSGNFPQLYPENSAIKIHASSNIIFKNNNYRGKAKVILEQDAGLRDLKFE